MKTRTAASLVLALGLGLRVPACGGQPDEPTLLIVNASVIDGTGAPARDAAVRIRRDRIVEVGALEPTRADSVIDAGGLSLAPGFIDTHSHADDGLTDQREAIAVVSQGITTVIIGQDGSSHYPLSSFFEELEATGGVAINVASYTGHGAIRRRALGDEFRRPATTAEITRMGDLLRADLHAGSLGLSTGLEYDPGIYSETDEVIALARIAAEAGGRYISHQRSEDRYFWSSLDEFLRIGRETGIPVQLSHAKLAMRGIWHQVDSVLALFERARADGIDVTADVYPYTYWQSGMTVLFPERNFSNRAVAAFNLRELVSPEGFLITAYPPEPSYEGKTLAEVIDLVGGDPVDVYLDLMARGEMMARQTGDEGHGWMIGTSMSEEDIESFMAWEFTNICSDGLLGGRHPRSFGAFPRVLGRYIRERRLFSLEEGIRKMTSLSAANTGITDRGTIEPGKVADLVLFNPETVIDRATPDDPNAVSAGIERVWVNGVLVWDGRRPTGRYPGSIIRRPTRGGPE